MILAAIDRWSLRASHSLCNLAVYGALPALLILVTLDVVLRYAFNSPMQWSRDVSGLLLLVTLFSALPHAWDQAYHIRMEIVHARLSTIWRNAADIVSAAAAFIFLMLLAVQAVMFSYYMYSIDETGEDLDALLWPFMLYVAFCGVVFAARVISNPSAERVAGAGASTEWI